MSEHALFVREFVRSPLRTASIVPSSSRLAEQMVAALPAEGDPVVVELGPGTGAFTAGTGTVAFTGPIPSSCNEYSGNRKTGCALMIKAGFSIDQFPCLDKLWKKESGWNHRAANPSSGAYGIPQSLPGSKMASAGRDWLTNAVTQIK